jgi:predicted DNA-binding transcriptional regulator AlpA
MKPGGQKRNNADAARMLTLRSADSRAFEDRRDRWMAKRRELEAHYLATGGPAALDYLHQLLRVNEAAHFLGTTSGQIYNLLANRAIPYIPWGTRNIRFCRLDLIVWQELRFRPPAG